MVRVVKGATHQGSKKHYWWGTRNDLGASRAATRFWGGGGGGGSSFPEMLGGGGAGGGLGGAVPPWCPVRGGRAHLGGACGEVPFSGCSSVSVGGGGMGRREGAPNNGWGGLGEKLCFGCLWCWVNCVRLGCGVGGGHLVGEGEPPWCTVCFSWEVVVVLLPFAPSQTPRSRRPTLILFLRPFPLALPSLLPAFPCIARGLHGAQGAGGRGLSRVEK